MTFNIDNFKLDRIRKSALVITADFCNDDIGRLLVTRPLNDLSFEVVNQLSGDDALEVYNKLIGA